MDESHLKVLDDSKGFSPGRIDLKKPLDHPDEHGRAAGSHVRHQCGDAAAASCRGAGAGDVHALCAGRQARPHRLAVAGRRRIAGVAGGAAGLALAPVVAAMLVRLMINADPGSEPYSTTIDGRVLLFTLAVSL
jgi:putative ABC transport system permease protein